MNNNPHFPRGVSSTPRKKVFGVGINDAPYPTATRNRKEGTTWRCPYHQRWFSMMRRCYSENALERNPTYRGVVVCDEWIYFMAFRGWMEQQEWEGKDLDKDFLSPGSKIYSPETCVFIDKRTNCVLSNCVRREKAKYPVGVTYRPNNTTVGRKYTACVCDYSGYKTYLGDFKTPEEAHKAWQKAKMSYIKELSRNQSDHRITEKLLEKAGQLQYEMENNLETVSLSW